MKNKFFELTRIPSVDPEYYNFRISGLQAITPYSDITNVIGPIVGGATALLQHRGFPGYCQLFYPYRKYEDCGDININFNPAYTLEGERVFIKFPRDCVFCVTQPNDYKNGDCIITFEKNPGIEDYEG